MKHVKNRQIIAVTATFTAEPVEEAVNFWMNELDIPCKVKFSPYNQVFQQLLGPASTLSTNQRGLNVVLIRLEDWWRGAADLHIRERVERNAKDLLDAMKFAAGNSRIPYLLCFCPGSQRIQTHETQARFFYLLEAEIAERLKDVTGIHVVTSTENMPLYPVAEYEDQKSRETNPFRALRADNSSIWNGLKPFMR
jgi:hypothetical protein